MAPISDLRIKKGVYKFESRKRYQYLTHFKVIERKPMDKLRDSLRAIFGPKKEEKKTATAISSSTGASPSGGFNVALMVGVVAFALLVILGGFLMWQINSYTLTPEPFKEINKSAMFFSIAQSDILTAGPRGTADHLSSVSVDYATSGLANYSVSIKTYSDDLPTEIFILNFDRVEASNYPTFLSSLRRNLAMKGIMLNEISIDQLASVPKGALIVVPSGVVPEDMLIKKGNITRLIDEGVVIVYIGQSFNFMQRSGGTVLTTPPQVKAAFPIGFDESNTPACTGNFSLFQPLYKVTGSSGYQSSLIYGCLSVLKKNSGAMVFVPSTLDGGWRSDGMETAAADISRIIIETPWAQSDGPGSSYVLDIVNGGAPSGQRVVFSDPYKGTNRTVKLSFTGYSLTGSILEDTKIITAVKTQKGELYLPQLAVTTTSVTGEKIRMNAKLDEAAPDSPQMYIIFIDGEGTEAGREPQGNINTQGDINRDVNIDLDQGEYKTLLIDDAEKVYAATYMRVESVTIGNPRQGAKPSIYSFDVSTPLTIKVLKLNLDNGAFTATFNNVPNGVLNVDVATYTNGDSLSYGNHTFDFTIGKLNKAVSYGRSLPPPPFPPELVLTVLIAGVVIGIGVYFARQEKVYFSIDIPDFPPVSRTKIPLNTDTVQSIFGKVNESYRWEYTPLTVTEVKNGFKNIFYKGAPVYITDYNAEFILNELTRKGKLRKFLDYYGLIEWEAKSGKPVRYLAMLRKLRDICVNNAIPFTTLGESKTCDSEITVVGQQMFLHFYSLDNSEQVLKSVLSTLGKGITIVLFKDVFEKGEFSNLLNSNSIAPLVMKMEIDNSSVLMLTYPELEKMVQEFKGV